MKQGVRHEFELKLELDEDGLARIAGSPELAALADGRPATRHLRSVYFDTDANDLHAAGVSLRIRESEEGRVQTVKLGTAMRGGISNPLESESPVAGPHPDFAAIADAGLRKKVKRLVRGRRLRPVFRTDITRQVHPLALAGGRAELALDNGILSCGRKKRAICEAEIELKAGDADCILEMTCKLLAGIPLRFSTAGKAQKGYELLSGKPPLRAVPVTAGEPRLLAQHDVAAAFADICQSAVDQILPNWRGVIESDDPEFAHQLRIGLRRLRTALRIFRPALDNPRLRALGRDLGEVGRIVGALRNADVLLCDIVRPVLCSMPSGEAGERLEALVAGRCAAERQRVAGQLADSRWNPLLLQLALLPHGAGWQGQGAGGGLAAFADSVLRGCWKKVRARACRLDELNDEERHRLRKDLKTLRYAAEFFAAILPRGRYRRFLATLKELQDAFGYLNDVALARTLPAMLDLPSRRDLDMAHAVGCVLGWHSALSGSAMAAIARGWKLLGKQPRLWK